MRSVVTVSNSLISAILDGTPLGDPVKDQLLDQVGLTWPRVRDLHARTSIVTLSRLWKRLVRATDDHVLGLRIGTVIPARRFGLTVQTAQHARDLRSAIEQFARYASLINDLLEARLEIGPHDARFVARLHWDVLGLERHAVDIVFAAFVAWTRQHLAAPLVVRELRLKHRLTAAHARYGEVFQAPVELSADRNEVVFDAAILDEPVVTSDAELAALLDRYASQELDRLPVVTDLPSRVGQLVRAALLASREVELASIAAELQMSSRRLQRRLGDHATSFSLLLDDTRRALAPTLLLAGGNVDQVGYQLGYSEPTAFIRAFKKWYGQTPGSFRKDRG
jgi:AraC-like DNA-binding protein